MLSLLHIQYSYSKELRVSENESELYSVNIFDWVWEILEAS